MCIVEGISTALLWHSGPLLGNDCDARTYATAGTRRRLLRFLRGTSPSLRTQQWNTSCHHQERIGQRVLWDLDLRMTALERPSNICTDKLQSRESKIGRGSPEGGLIPGQTGRLAVGRKIILTSTWLVDEAGGGGLEYFHRSPTSRKRRKKGNPISIATVRYRLKFCGT
jgi:hypothetical protein